MADLRLWNKEMIGDFIEMYKSYPCLWKVKSEDYKKRYLKSNAYKELIQFCKKRGFPEATKDFVVKKLQSLRGSFRKELRKTRQYQIAGETYQSSLWYYNNLLFTIDQEAETSDDGNQTDEDTNQSLEGIYDEVDEEKFLVDTKPSQIGNVPEYSANSPKSLSPPPKRTKDYIQPEFLDIDSARLGQDSSKLKDLSEFELIGMNITKKLARMDPTQAIYAESIINNVIRKGLLKKLTEDTNLCDSMCGRRPYIPSQSSDKIIPNSSVRLLPNTSM